MESLGKYISLPILLTIIGGLIISIVGFISSCYSNSSKPKWIPIFIFLGGIVVIVSGVFTSIDQAKFQDLLIEKTTKIEKDNKEVTSLLTGGDSFAYVSLTIAKDPSADHLEFNIVNQGDYPIHDLAIEVTDHDYLTKLYYEAKSKGIPLTLQYFEKAKITRMIGTIGPHKVVNRIATATMPSASNDRNFLITINSLYDQYYQNLHIRRNTDGRLSIDSMVKSGDKVLYSLGDINYFQPRAEPSTKQKSNYGWVLTDQGESITVMAIDGKWLAFDAKGQLVEPQQIGKGK